MADESIMDVSFSTSDMVLVISMSYFLTVEIVLQNFRLGRGSREAETKMRFWYFQLDLAAKITSHHQTIKTKQNHHHFEWNKLISCYLCTKSNQPRKVCSSFVRSRNGRRQQLFSKRNRRAHKSTRVLCNICWTGIIK